MGTKKDFKAVSGKDVTVVETETREKLTTLKQLREELEALKTAKQRYLDRHTKTLAAITQSIDELKLFIDKVKEAGATE